MKLSVVIPAYNEVGTIEEIISRVQAIALEKEIIVVDDGSTDGTRERIEEISQDGGNIRALYHRRNRGKGAALRTGFEAVNGDVVVIQDADLEYDPKDLYKLVKPLEEKKAHVVYGSRRLNPANTHRSGLSFYLGGIVVTYLSRWLYGLKITDEATCYKLIDAKLIKSLNLECERFEFCPEVTAKIAKRKIPIIELPISYYPRYKKDGKKIGWRDGVEAIWTLIRCRFKD